MASSIRSRWRRWADRPAVPSFGDPGAFTAPIRQAGAVLIIQVTDLAEARQAVDLGADLIVAQGVPGPMARP